MLWPPGGAQPQPQPQLSPRWMIWYAVESSLWARAPPWSPWGESRADQPPAALTQPPTSPAHLTHAPRSQRRGRAVRWHAAPWPSYMFLPTTTLSMVVGTRRERARTISSEAAFAAHFNAEVSPLFSSDCWSLWPGFRHVGSEPRESL